MLPLVKIKPLNHRLTLCLFFLYTSAEKQDLFTLHRDEQHSAAHTNLSSKCVTTLHVTFLPATNYFSFLVAMTYLSRFSRIRTTRHLRQLIASMRLPVRASTHTHREREGAGSRRVAVIPVTNRKVCLSLLLFRILETEKNAAYRPADEPGPGLGLSRVTRPDLDGRTSRPATSSTCFYSFQTND